VASRIPNYELQRAFDDNAELRQVTKLTLWKGVSTLRLTLWDEDSGQLVGFRELRAIRARLAAELQAGAAIMATKPEAVPVSWR
jgi:omega-6 fatty acid desaturase (delta-12 desaturase)